MEAPSSHPLSATLVDAAKREGVGLPMNTTVSQHSILKGEGVTALVDDSRVYVGNERLFKRLGMYDELPASCKESATKWNKAGGTVGFCGIEGVGVIGVFCMSDAIRKDAKQVVAALLGEGFEVMMLTGDGDGAANAVGWEVGLSPENIHSQLLPEDKLHFIGSIKFGSVPNTCNPCSSKDLVLMCGDGVNDAPALAVSDVGVAMGEGAALAMEMSDVTLMDSNLTKLLFSIKMGGRVIRTIRENIVFSLVAKIIVVALTFLGKMTLLLAIAADVGVMLAVTLNGMKLLPAGSAIDVSTDQISIKMKTSGGRLSGAPMNGNNDLPDVV
mmetsp:Transcript_10000/g.14650  ORF Transcript_10000/g.14650 Transcript_10000/m.14650 type:complete len:328 (+) Transcript_10000:173-1156(+)